MKDIIILEQCKICNNHLILRESGCYKGGEFKTYLLKYCSNSCIPFEEIVEIKQEDTNG